MYCTDLLLESHSICAKLDSQNARTSGKQLTELSIAAKRVGDSLKESSFGRQAVRGRSALR